MKVLEEDVVEAHRNMLDGLEQWRQQDVVLLSMTNAVDYDQVFRVFGYIRSCSPISTL